MIHEEAAFSDYPSRLSMPATNWAIWRSPAMKTFAIVPSVNSRRLARKCLALVILALQCGCALPMSEGSWGLPKWQMPFVSDDKGKTPAEACAIAGRTLGRKGEYKKAIAKFEEARNLDPLAPVAHPLALLYNRQGDVEQLARFSWPWRQVQGCRVACRHGLFCV